MHLKPPPANLITQLLTSSLSSLSQTSLPYSSSSLAITSIFLRHGLISNLTLGNPQSPSPQTFNELPLPSRRIWVGLKFRDNNPVLRKGKIVSKASKRVMVTHEELGRLLTGRRARNVEGLGLSEVLVVRDMREGGERGTQESYLEGWEAWRKGLGGEVVCRAG